MENLKNSTTKRSSSLIFFGNERLSTAFELHGAPTLEALIAAGYNVRAIVSHYEAGRSRKNRPLEIAEVARANNIPLFLPEKLSDIKEELAAYKAEAGVLVAYGKMVSQEIIDLFPKGIVNIHPSLLPQYRGPTPIEQAILDGVSETGVSLMQLVKAMDAGPIFAQTTLPLKGTEQKQELTEKLMTIGKELLLTHLSAILNTTLVPTPQDDERATYCRLLSKADTEIDFSLPASTLERQVRAFAGWPGSKAVFTLPTGNSTEAILTQTTVASDLQIQPGHIHIDQNRLYIGTGKGALEVKKLKIPGKKEITAAEYIRGYRL